LARGALPPLQRRFAPLWASLILGAIWGFLHLPVFLLSRTPQSAWWFGSLVIGVLALSVILTLMFNAGCGSILSAILFHFQMNCPAWPDAQPWENFLLAVVAVVVMVLNRRIVLACDGAVNEVLLPAEDGSSDHAHIDT
jgi:membrane protease YdiL (CAAX protease family)